MGIGTHADNKLGRAREEPGGGILKEIGVLSQHKKLWTIVKVGRPGAAAQDEGRTAHERKRKIATQARWEGQRRAIICEGD